MESDFVPTEGCSFVSADEVRLLADIIMSIGMSLERDGEIPPSLEAALWHDFASITACIWSRAAEWCSRHPEEVRFDESP